MQTRVQLSLTALGIVRMFGIKSSMKRIVWWYFSWPACLVRSGKPWPCELGSDCFGSMRLDLVTGAAAPVSRRSACWDTLFQLLSGPKRKVSQVLPVFCVSASPIWKLSCEILLTRSLECKRKQGKNNNSWFFYPLKNLSFKKDFRNKLVCTYIENRKWKDGWKLNISI